MNNNLVIIIMVGAPCSGKTTWISNNYDALCKKYNMSGTIISRDVIRDNLFGKKYKQNTASENKISYFYYQQLKSAITQEKQLIFLDNTHLKESYIDTLLVIFKSYIESGKAKIFIKEIKAPYWKLYLRNITRKVRTGKWIPIKVLKRFYNRQNSLDLTKYKQYYYE